MPGRATNTPGAVRRLRN
jgi:hypothetical protein